MRPIERRLAQIVAALAALRPKPVPELPEGMEWVPWLTFTELDRIELIYHTAAEEGREELTGAERAETLSIQAMAISRQLTGGPPYCEDRARYDRTDRS